MRKVTILLLLLAASQVAAQDRFAVPVQTTPAGAIVLLDGALVGVSPMTLSLLGRSGISRVEMQLEGYAPFEVTLDYVDLPEALAAELDLRRSTIPVTTPYDLMPAPDGEITLREAIEYSSGATSPKGADAILIDGPVGADRPDSIMVQISGFQTARCY